jgi:hypothetical protein
VAGDYLFAHQVSSMDQATVVCVRLRPSSKKETGVRCIRPEGEQDVTFTNPDHSLSSYGYDKVYGAQHAQLLTLCKYRFVVQSAAASAGVMQVDFERSCKLLPCLLSHAACAVLQ